MSTAAQVISLNSALTACERADEWQLAAAMLRSLRGWGDEIHPGPSPSPLWECHLGWNLIDYILFMIFFQIKISIFWGGVCIFILTNTQMGHSDHWTLIWGGFLQPDATSSAICTAAFGKPSMDWCCSNLGLPWFVQKWCIPQNGHSYGNWQFEWYTMIYLFFGETHTPSQQKLWTRRIGPSSPSVAWLLPRWKAPQRWFIV